MEIKEIIGIDVSKNELDVRIHTSKEYTTFVNNKKGFRRLLKWVFKTSSFKKEEIFFIFEHTGLYSYQLATFLTEQEIPFAMVPGLEIKRTLGLARGKSDKVDATRIARYAYQRRDEIEPYKLASKELQELSSLFTLRQRLVRQRAGFLASLGEIKRVKLKKDNKIEFSITESMIKKLSKEIDKVDERMEEIITNAPSLKRLYDLITSIKGIGAQNAYILLVTTQGFTKFKAWRQYAAYAGVAPFPHQSGTSIRGKNKVSHLANKTVKTLLSSAAKSAVQHDAELRAFYQRKLDQGKLDAVVTNIIRCKLLARVWAVVNRGTPFVDTYKFAT